MSLAQDLEGLFRHANDSHQAGIAVPAQLQSALGRFRVAEDFIEKWSFLSTLNSVRLELYS